MNQGLLSDLLAGAIPAMCVGPAAGSPRALLPGSFNPLHAGHLGMADAAARRLGVPVAFELSVVNVDKPPLGEEEIRRRLAQFAGVASVWLTRAPTFVEKARLFVGARFIVGADTAARVVEARYYGGDAGLRAAIADIRERGCRFLVAGRLVGGAFLACDQLAIDAAYRDLFEALAEEEFRLDVSSTALRGERGV